MGVGINIPDSICELTYLSGTIINSRGIGVLDTTCKSPHWATEHRRTPISETPVFWISQQSEDTTKEILMKEQNK
jgi:hypothetical protein